MTISRRLILLQAVPLALLGKLGDIALGFSEMRVQLRSQLLASDPFAQAAARAAFDSSRAR